MTTQDLQKDFDKILKNDILSNKYFTHELINKIVVSPVYVSLKNIETPIFQLYSQQWSYYFIRLSMFGYINYEFWVNVKGYPDYLISTEGRIWSNYSNKIMKTGNIERMEKEDLYPHIMLSVNKKRCPNSLHVLVMESFLPPECPRFEITNHRDGYKRNPALWNLEPSDASHNCIHSQKLLKNNNYVTVYRTLYNEIVNFNDNNDEVISYNTIKEAADANNLAMSTLKYNIDNNNPILINGKKYIFSRDQQKYEQEFIEISPEEMLNFKEIGEIICYKNNILETYNFNDYSISKIDGKIIKKDNKMRYKLIKPSINHGYYTISLTVNKVSHKFRINRLVLIVHGTTKFIIHEGKQIFYWDLIADHIDEQKLNNNINNLRWVNASQNCIHSITYKPIKLTYNGISTVLPSVQKLSDISKRDVNNIRGDIGRKKKFFGNDIEYITEQEYINMKDKNRVLFLFKEIPYCVYKYDKNIFVEKFDSLDDAGKNVGVTRSPLSQKLTKIDPIQYIHNYNGENIVTPLNYKILDYKQYKWVVLFGTMIIIDNSELLQACL